MPARRPSARESGTPQPYGLRDVEKLLRLPRSTVRALVAAGFVAPTRGARGAWQFSFQDLIVLRSAQALADADVPARRITKSVRDLRRRLPASMPLSGLAISAVGDRIVVRERGRRWQADTGQYLLELDGEPGDGARAGVARANRTDAAAHGTSARAKARGAQAAAQEWFEKAVALEARNADAAAEAYRRAVASDARYVDARINLGRLLHEAKRFAQAERVYRDALGACGEDPVLLFNLGVLYDDLDRAPEAVLAYEAALRRDPSLADAHYNLSLLCEKLARPKDALRHMARYRALTSARSR